jgi:hypothetical protein
MFTYLKYLSAKLKCGKTKTFTKITDSKESLKMKHTNPNTSFKKDNFKL